MYRLSQLIVVCLVCSAWCADSDSDDGGVGAFGVVFEIPHVLQRPLCALGVWKVRSADFPDEGQVCDINSNPWYDTINLRDESRHDRRLACVIPLATENPQDLLNVFAKKGDLLAQMGAPPTCSVVFQPEYNGGHVCIKNKLSGENTECCFLNNIQQPNLFCEYRVYLNCMTITRFLTEYNDGAKFFVRISVNYGDLHKFVVQWGTRDAGPQEDLPEEIVQGAKDIDQNVEGVAVGEERLRA